MGLLHELNAQPLSHIRAGSEFSLSKGFWLKKPHCIRNMLSRTDVFLL